MAAPGDAARPDAINSLAASRPPAAVKSLIDAAKGVDDLAKGTDLLVLDVTARPETSATQLEEEVEVEVDRLHRDGVSEVEVRRAAALIETDLAASLQSAGERADRLSMFATFFGEPALINEQADRYRAVTTEQVNELISERFGENNRASLIYVPREGIESEGILVAAGTG